MRGVQIPLCAFNEVSNKKIVETLLGRRVRVAEVACAALGVPHCKIAFYKH